MLGVGWGLQSHLEISTELIGCPATKPGRGLVWMQVDILPLKL